MDDLLPESQRQLLGSPGWVRPWPRGVCRGCQEHKGIPGRSGAPSDPRCRKRKPDRHDSSRNLLHMPQRLQHRLVVVNRITKAAPLGRGLLGACRRCQPIPAGASNISSCLLRRAASVCRAAGAGARACCGTASRAIANGGGRAVGTFPMGRAVGVACAPGTTGTGLTPLLCEGFADAIQPPLDGVDAALHLSHRQLPCSGHGRRLLAARGPGSGDGPGQVALLVAGALGLDRQLPHHHAPVLVEHVLDLGHLLEAAPPVPRQVVQ
mmetsp:Transcript_67787/g.220663  ORF Transcript_67787/g.220663 Transcript_67787/m.220663 type:complete len:266 (+) Transcript_67787:1805-2602(+)